MSAPDRLTAALADRYRIERKLGAGGMATVYLAHDIKHDRKVAIKVLKPELAAVLGAERFVQEIKTTAALQHPHILPLFDSGTADHQLFYVMPFVQGETLREKLNRETQFGVDEAVRIACEVADALDYAHRHGVVHRDIKPENIMLHDGRPMVMDFGIALAVSAAAGGRMTETGLSLGTPHYMSPEQATADKEITGRSDIYSLGAVLYEMLAGQPPHLGGSAQQIIMKIIAEQTQPVTVLRKSVPPNVAAALTKALEKLPADRFETAKAFSDALANTTFTTASASITSPHATRRGRVLLGAVAMAAFLIGAAAWSALSRPMKPAAPPEIKVPIEFKGGAHARGSGMTISRDGTKLAFMGTDSSGNPMLFLQSLTDLTIPPIQVAATAGAPAFSPSGDGLAYISSQELWITSLKGGSPRRIAPVESSGSLDWGADSSLIVSSLGALVRISATGAQIDTIAKPRDSVTYYRFPSFATRDLVLFEINNNQTSSNLAVLNMRDRRVTELGIAGIRPTLVDGHILVYFLADGSAWGVEFDPRTLKSSGTPRPIASQVSIGGLSRPMAAVAANGTMVYITGLSPTQRELVLIDRATKQPRALSKTRQAWRFPRFSPNGKQIAITVEGLNGIATGDLWVFGADGTGPLRVTSDRSSYQAEWDPDGLNLIYPHRLANGTVALMRSPANGTPGTAQLLTRKNPIYESRITPDRKTLIWREDAFANNRDIYFAPLDSPTVARPLLNSAFDEKGLALSPDGHWLAYVSNESNQNEVYVRRLEPNAPRKLVSTHGGTEPRWAGNEIFYRRGDTVMVVRVTLGAEPQVAPAIALFNGAYARINYEPLWDVSPDGRTFAMVRSAGGEQAQLVLYANWAAHW